MINFFTDLYSSIQSKNQFLKKIRFYSLLRFIVRNIANALLPLYLQISNLFKIHKLILKENDIPQVIVSLTTFPARINKIWMVIECMLRQTQLPDKIILWLSKEQFPGPASLPHNLLKLQSRGLEIKFCDEDLRSHKKYYYTLINYPDDILITIDDDIFYRTDLINDLMKLHIKHPKGICCDRALGIKTMNGEILPYHEWELIKKGEGPSYDIFPTGAGGILYPPGCLAEEALNKEVFMKYCNHADDIWLNVMAQLNKTQMLKTDINTIWLPVINKGNTTLTTINVDQRQNDKQLKEIRDYFRRQLNKDPYSNLFT